MGTEIWIIESLRRCDEKTGKSLFKEIMKRDVAIKNELQVKFCTASNAGEFYCCLNDVLQSADAGNFPMLHIEAHGDEDGLQLTNDDLIDWPDLSSPLARINEAMKGWLVVTVAACSGAHMAKTALDTVRAPFLALIGPPERIDDCELLNDFTEFYIEFDKTRSLTKARWALNSFRIYKSIYYFTTSESCFIQLFEGRINESLSPKERAARVSQIASRLVAPLATPEEKNSAIFVSTYLVDNPREFVFRAWRQFVFADKHPENLDIFPFPFR